MNRDPDTAHCALLQEPGPRIVVRGDGQTSRVRVEWGSVSAIQVVPYYTLLHYARLSDGRLDPLGRLLPGDGSLPLRQLLDVLPARMLFSVEVPMPSGSRFTTAEWVRLVIEKSRSYLNLTNASEE